MVRSVNTNGDDENIDVLLSYISRVNVNDWTASDAYQDCIKRFYMTVETTYRNKNRDTPVPLFDIAM